MINNKNNKGFTLTEILIVIGVLSIVMIGVIVAINPDTQFKVARDNRREAHLNMLYNAFIDYSARNSGDFPSCVTVFQVDIYNCSELLEQNYISEMPIDPDLDCAAGQTGYFVKISPIGRIGLKAACTENKSNPITVGDWIN